MLPALIERARREVALARVVGKFTVDLGVATVRRRVAGGRPPAPYTDVEALVEMPEQVERAEPAEPAPIATTIRADQLVLPDYEHLPAAHVVAKLASLTPRERDAVEEFERANRHRRTILGKLDQLRANP
ncbi:MAG: hypothetical protein ABWZ99_18590 [Ilumatobacteraceae bacterium]